MNKRKFDTDTTYISSSSNCLEDDENQLNRFQFRTKY